MPLCRCIKANVLWLTTLGVAGLIGPLCAFAQQPTGVKQPVKCGGTDQVAVLARTHPDVHKVLLERASKTANADAILWRITRDEGGKLEPSYLFGTVHVTDERIALPDEVRRLVAGARSVAVEVADLAPRMVVKEMQTLPQLIVYTDGTNLESRLSPEELSKLKSLMAPFGMPEQAVPLLKPWLAMLLLAIPECERNRNAAGRPVLDMQIANVAKENDISLVSLETITLQLKAMANMSDDDQVKHLKLTLKMAEDRESALETTLQAYLRRRLGLMVHIGEAFANIMRIEGYDPKALNKALLDGRNLGMFERSLPLVRKGAAFVAVGAMHLVGDTGLVAQYRRAGYRVEPIL